MAVFNIVATADDVHRVWQGGDGAGEYFDSELWAGSWAYDIWEEGYHYEGRGVDEMALRFTNITIPKGATITSAKITLKTRSDYGGNYCDLDIQACNEDNSAQMTSFANFGSRPRTTANIAWTQTFTLNTVYDTPEIKTVIQEIVNRANWASGNAMQFIISDHSYKYPSLPPSGNFDAWGYFLEDAAYNISLTVEYIAHTDIGLRIKSSTEIIKIGVLPLEATHKLRVRKGDTTYGIPLLETNDPFASAVRVCDGNALINLAKQEGDGIAHSVTTSGDVSGTTGSPANTYDGNRDTYYECYYQATLVTDVDKNIGMISQHTWNTERNVFKAYYKIRAEWYRFGHGSRNFYGYFRMYLKINGSWILIKEHIYEWSSPVYGIDRNIIEKYFDLSGEWSNVTGAKIDCWMRNWGGEIGLPGNDLSLSIFEVEALGYIGASVVRALPRVD